MGGNVENRRIVFSTCMRHLFSYRSAIFSTAVVLLCVIAPPVYGVESNDVSPFTKHIPPFRFPNKDDVPLNRPFVEHDDDSSSADTTRRREEQLSNESQDSVIRSFGRMHVESTEVTNSNDMDDVVVDVGIDFVATDYDLSPAEATTTTTATMMTMRHRNLEDADNSYPSSCSDITSCSECYKSYKCHWCAFDDACHAYGSWYGCQWGEECSARQSCQRSSPEPYEYGGVGNLMVGCVAFASFVLVSLCLAWRQQQWADSTGLGDDLISSTTMDRMPRGDGDDLRNRVIEMTDAINTMTTVKKDGSDSSNTTLSTNSSPTTPARASLRSTTVAHIKTCFDKLLSQNLSVKGTLIAAGIATAIALTTAYFPIAPSYSICSDQVDWSSIVSSILSANRKNNNNNYNYNNNNDDYSDGSSSNSVSVTFDLLTSIHNPNRFSLTLTNGRGIMYYEDESIATMSIPDFTARKRSITDVMVTLTVSPQLWQTVGVLSDYYQGELSTFVMDSKVKVYIGDKSSPFHFRTKWTGYEIRFDTESEVNRDLCKCPEWSR